MPPTRVLLLIGIVGCVVLLNIFSHNRSRQDGGVASEAEPSQNSHAMLLATNEEGTRRRGVSTVDEGKGGKGEGTGADKEPLRFFSSDFHISPVADIKNLLKDFNVQVIDKSLSGHCHLSNTCERDLKVLTKGNGIHLDPCPNDIRRSFYNSYRCDPEFHKVDAFLCNHAAALCEVFMPFNTSIIVVATTRYEIGRHSKDRWQGWNENLRRIAANPYNVVAANNKYDQEYIKYFTGIDNVLLLPSYCGYIQDRYKPIRSEILIAPARGVSKALNDMLLQKIAETNLNKKMEKEEVGQKQQHQKKELKVAHIRDLYPHFKYNDIAAHPAIIVLPYQIRYVRLSLPFPISFSLMKKQTISLCLAFSLYIYIFIYTHIYNSLLRPTRQFSHPNLHTTKNVYVPQLHEFL